MELENQIYQVKERLENLKNKYQMEVNSLINSPKCFISKNLRLTANEEECLRQYPEPFLKALAHTIKHCIDYDWRIEFDLGGTNSGNLKSNRPPKSVSYTVKHDWDDKVTSVGVTKTF